MTSLVLPSTSRGAFALRPLASRALDVSARIWFAAAVAGQAAFLYFIVAFYGPTLVSGHFEAWKRNTFLIKGYVAGDTAGNLAFAAHVTMAAAVTLAGLLQFLPIIRRRAPAFHRWNGRVFMVAAGLAALDGLWMNFVRGAHGGPISTTGISLDAVLILVFGGVAWRAARLRQYASHRRWAMRTFMVANGVWFIRLGFVAWGLAVHLVTGGKPAMDGPFWIVWPFGCYLLPLAALELYLRARDGGGPGLRLAASGVIIFLTGLMCIGSVGTWMVFWAPILAKA